MFNLKNREYEKVLFFVPNKKVCFKMKNGLTYLVNFKRDMIYVDATCEKFLDEDSTDAEKLPKEQLIKAEKTLKTAEIPKLDKFQEEKFMDILKNATGKSRKNRTKI